MIRITAGIDDRSIAIPSSTHGPYKLAEAAGYDSNEDMGRGNLQCDHNLDSLHLCAMVNLTRFVRSDAAKCLDSRHAIAVAFSRTGYFVNSMLHASQSTSGKATDGFARNRYWTYFCALARSHRPFGDHSFDPDFRVDRLPSPTRSRWTRGESSPDGAVAPNSSHAVLWATPASAVLFLSVGAAPRIFA